MLGRHTFLNTLDDALVVQVKSSGVRENSIDRNA
jgi:hypothetical protein